MGSELTNGRGTAAALPAQTPPGATSQESERKTKGFLATSITEIPTPNGHYSILFVFKEGAES